MPPGPRHGAARPTSDTRGRATSRQTRSTSTVPGTTPAPSANTPLSGFVQPQTPARPTSLHMPSPGENIHLPPASAGRGPAKDVSQSRSPSRSASPLRLPDGSTAHSTEWLSMKHPDLLSASERVIHHNMGNLAVRIDQMQQVFVFYASARATGAKASTAGTADPRDDETKASDEAILAQLDDDGLQGVIRDQMNVFKGALGKPLTDRKGTNGTEQAEAFVKHLGEAAAQEENDMDTSTETDERPIGSLHAKVTSLSEFGRDTWYFATVKELGLSPKRTSKSSNTAKGAGGKGKKRSAGGEIEGDDGDDAGRKKRKRTQAASAEDVEEENEDDG